MSASNPASNDKVYLRDYFSEKRLKLCQELSRKEALDAEIQTRLIISPEYRAADTVLVYMARPTEISTSMIIHAALANNKIVALPVCTDDSGMIFRQIGDISELRPGRFGILEPDDSCPEYKADENTLCVCPALCCDMRGYRLGFGGGYYDRF
ncbi:MAG: 5-formyltetrahydrofolate cyclo-ligase, partial [Ruminococcus sp.]|nr:5-formyltetrahydrofolate cyclo-ligase [Ruminococcus sp.]